MVCTVSHEIFMQFRRKLGGVGWGGAGGKAAPEIKPQYRKVNQLAALDSSAGQTFHPRNFVQELFTFSCRAC